MPSAKTTRPKISTVEQARKTAKKLSKTSDLHVVCVIDRSGSMASIWGSTISGLKDFLESQRKESGKTYVTLVDFDVEYTVDFSAVDINELPGDPLDGILPRGGTALYDAVGRAIGEVESNPTDGNVLVVVVTDGEENSSREWTRDTLFAKIADKEESGWSFVYIGSDRDTYAAASNIGVSAGYTSKVAATPMGTTALYAGLSTSTSSYRSSAGAQGLAPTNFFTTEDGTDTEDGTKDGTDESTNTSK